MTSTLTQDETPSAWSFKTPEIAGKFDNHVREQLAWYDPLSHYVAEMAVSFIPKWGRVYDIGASTGNMCLLLEKAVAAKGAYLEAIEPSREMVSRFKTGHLVHGVNAEDFDFTVHPPNLSILFLTLMFMDPAVRSRFMTELMEATRPGGAIFVIDKGYLRAPRAQVACKSALLAEKLRAGSTADAYVAKELSLRGEQRPTDQHVLEDLAEENGFTYEPFFQFGEFFGVVLVKHSL